MTDPLNDGPVPSILQNLICEKEAPELTIRGDGAINPPDRRMFRRWDGLAESIARSASMPSHSRQEVEQAGVIPFRRKKDKIEFCLITSVRKGNWGFPKGMIDVGEKCEEAALKEAYEEAGLHGEIVGDPLGGYTYAKWGLDLNVTVLLMQVNKTDSEWQEEHLRRRCWVSPNKTRRLLVKTELVDLLDDALERIEQLTA